MQFHPIERLVAFVRTGHLAPANRAYSQRRLSPWKTIPMAGPTPTLSDLPTARTCFLCL